MSNTQVFNVDIGSAAGMYCSYCGKRIIPKAATEGPLIFACDCAYAKAELAINEAMDELSVKKAKLFESVEKLVELTQARVMTDVYEGLLEGAVTRYKTAIKDLDEARDSDRLINEAKS